MSDRLYCVCIMTNKDNRVLYTGVTGNLQKRVWEHKQHLVPGFTHLYNVMKLVYYDVCDNPMGAISREKEIKGWVRAKKIRLIESINPEWQDLSENL